MKLNKICTKCNKELTTKNSKLVGRNNFGLFLNCKACNSTFLLKLLSLLVCVVLSSCAPPKDNSTPTGAAITIACEVIDTCTYYNPFLRNAVYSCVEKNVSTNPCITTREDWHLEYQICGQSVCTTLVQGPGPQAIPNQP